MYLDRMPVMLQVRNVPDAVHRTLKSRAALKGVALSDYALEILRRETSRPTREEMLQRLKSLNEVRTREAPATLIREGRRGR
jgi:plasmid stability protein